jgi:hypothetical protein
MGEHEEGVCMTECREGAGMRSVEWKQIMSGHEWMRSGCIQ